MLSNIRFTCQAYFRRVLQSCGFSEGSNNTGSIQESIYNFFHDRLGNKFKYVVFMLLLTSFLLYENIVYDHEIAIRHKRTISPSPSHSLLVQTHKNETHYILPYINSNSPQFLNTTLHTHNMSNITSNDTQSSGNGLRKVSNDSRMWISLTLSLLSWMVILQLIQYIRNRTAISFSQGGATRQQQQLQLIRQLARMAGGGNNVGGFANRLQLALLQREFTGDDYELLRQLDEDNPGQQGATEEEINRLPLHTITTEEWRQQHPYQHDSSNSTHDADTADGDVSVDLELQGISGGNECNICLGPYEVGEEVRTVACLHRFHRQCIDPWLRTNATCPICKFPAVQ